MDGQHVCGFLPELPKRIVLLSHVQAGKADPSLGADLISVSQGSSHSGSPEPGGGPTLKAKAGDRGVEVTPPGGEPDMAEVWPSGGGSAHQARPLIVRSGFPCPPITSGSGHADPGMARDQPISSLYAFPPIRLLSAILLRVQTDRVESLLPVALFWPS